jgi:outer membrane protein
VVNFIVDGRLASTCFLNCYRPLKLTQIVNLTLCLFLSFLLPIQTAAACSSDEENCVPVDQWQLSIAVGLGTLSNPLHGGNNIPLIVLPYIHYYGEQFFIENNVLGYSFYQSDSFIISGISQLNREKAFFTDWQPSHLFIPNSSESLIGSSDEKPVNKSDVKKRDWAIDAGLQINWFINDLLEVKAQLLHDINNVYHGFNAHLGLQKTFALEQLPNTRLSISAGANWQSAELADYYYGLHEDDDVDLFNLYQADAGIQPYFSFSLTHKINKNWQLKLLAKREFLDSNLTDSPLIEDDTITSAFIGVVYAF